jgi:transposase InsO family protein
LREGARWAKRHGIQEFREVYMPEDKSQRIATFRFGVIHDLVGGTELSPGEQERLIREKCDRKWVIPYSLKTRLTRSTIMRWVKRYRESGGKLESLCSHARSDQGRTRAIDEETQSALTALRKELPQVTIARLIKEMEKRRLVSPGTKLTKSTVHRLLKRNGLMEKTPAMPEDRRRFEAEMPNDLWQCDCMHGPTVRDGEGGKRRKTYLFAFLDDHSRLVPHAQFSFSESVEAYLHALEYALSTRGLPKRIYTDNGSAFRSHHLEHVLASLGIALVHARPYKPQGKGKIERFFRTVRSDLLPNFRGETLEDLNLAMYWWLREEYHQRKHSSTGQSPFDRFTSNIKCLREAPKDLKDHFRKTARRRVAKDRTISLHGRIFEAPVPLIGKQVSLLYHEKEPDKVEVMSGEKSHGMLVPVDVHVNSRVRRNKDGNIEIDQSESDATYKGGGLWGKKKIS